MLISGYVDLSIECNPAAWQLVDTTGMCGDRASTANESEIETDEKGLFKIIGGFPNIDLMEDIRICEILKKFSPPYIIESKITTSSRKWKSNGFFRTVFKMRLLRFLYTIGLNTGFLRKHY